MAEKKASKKSSNMKKTTGTHKKADTKGHNPFSEQKGEVKTGGGAKKKGAKKR